MRTKKRSREQTYHMCFDCRKGILIVEWGLRRLNKGCSSKSLFSEEEQTCLMKFGWNHSRNMNIKWKLLTKVIRQPPLLSNVWRRHRADCSTLIVQLPESLLPLATFSQTFATFWLSPQPQSINQYVFQDFTRILLTGYMVNHSYNPRTDIGKPVFMTDLQMFSWLTFKWPSWLTFMTDLQIEYNRKL